MKLYVFADKIPEKCVECDFICYDTGEECSVCGLSGREVKNAEKRDNSCKLGKATKAIKKRNHKSR
jgi:hypothetical protein